MIPQETLANHASQQMSGGIKSRLTECLERDEQGRPRPTVTLCNEGALEALARSLASLLAIKQA
jgi:hypothetical protein